MRVFLNGNNYECVDVSRLAYIPTTYEALDPGALKDTIPEDYGKGYEKEQRKLHRKAVRLSKGKEKKAYGKKDKPRKIAGL